MPTWDSDDATWGGSVALFGQTLPVYSYGMEFFQAGNLLAPDLVPLDITLERVGLTVASVDREGKPRSDPSVVKLLTEIWPVIRGVPGTVINIYAGAQDDPEAGVSWQGPFSFTLGTSKSVQPIVQGAYLAVRFVSVAQPPWYLLSYDLDIEVLGRLPV